MTKEEFTIAVTASEFGSVKKFYKSHAKGNRIITVEAIEYENTSEQHVTGIFEDVIVCNKTELKSQVEKYIEKNELWHECFAVSRRGKKRVIMTEENL